MYVAYAGLRVKKNSHEELLKAQKYNRHTNIIHKLCMNVSYLQHKVMAEEF